MCGSKVKLEKIKSEGIRIQPISEESPLLQAVMTDKTDQLNAAFNEVELERIPKNGPVITVSNHPFGALDGLILIYLVTKVLPDIKVMANVLEQYEEDLEVAAHTQIKPYTMNFGPQHPATHGTLRNIIELDGEMVTNVIPEIGYLHSGFEKLAEYRSYNQVVTITDRMNYLSPLCNHVGFSVAVEKMLGIEKLLVRERRY